MPKQFSSRQVAGRFSRIAAGFAVLLGIFALCDLGLASPPLDPAPAGKVRFYNIADSDFDRYSKNPDKRTQAWMRAAFTRMQTYSPYFDKRLRWYPNAWVYKDSYALKPHWPEYRKQPDWVLRDAQGNQLYIPWGCQRGSCPQFAADMGNPEFQAHWIEQAREKIAPGYRRHLGRRCQPDLAGERRRGTAR